MFGNNLPIPSVSDTTPRGFPSPAQDYFSGGIDLNRHLIRDRTCTFIMRVEGESMAGSGICGGDEIIVDRSLTPKDGSVVVVVLEGELSIKRIRFGDNGITLETSPLAGNGIHVPELAELMIWGVVTRCLHHV